MLFRVYNAGLCNQLLGLEAGLGIATLFGRTFVPYGGDAAQNGPTSDPRFRRVGPAPGGGRPFEVPPHHAGKVDPVTRAGLLELFDLPAPFERIEDVLARGPLEGLVDLVPPPPDRARRWLADCVWTDDDPDAEPGEDALVAEFVVDPSAQRQGHGSRLLNAVADTLRADGFTRPVD